MAFGRGSVVNEYITSLGLMLCIFVLPAVLIYSYIRPAKFNIRSDKNPTGGNSRAAFSAGMLVTWLASAVMVWQFYEPALSEEERLAIVREVAAEMNAEPDANTVITVGDDGSVVVEPVGLGQ